WRADPIGAARACTGKCRPRIDPSLTRIATRAPAPEVQQGLALRIEMKEAQHALTLVRGERGVAADQLVIDHAAVAEGDGGPGLDAHLGAERQARAEDDGIEKVAFEAEELRHRPVIEGAGKRRN